MRTVWTITGKDLRLRLRDRSVLLIAFVVPVVLTYVFSLVFGGLTGGGLGSLTFGVAALDEGRVGQAFRDEYLPRATAFLDTGDGEVDLVDVPSASDARAGVEAGRFDAAFVVPTGTTDALADAEPVDFEVVTHADADTAGDVAEQFAEQFAVQARGQLAAQVLAERLQLPPDRAAEFASSLGSVRGRIRLDSSLAGSQQLDLSTYLAAGMAVFFLFFTVGFGVIGYLEERRDGTLPRLLAAPVQRWQVLAAKALVSLAVGVLSVAALMVAAVPLLGARWGDPFAVAVLVVAAVVAATSLVSVVAGLARTAEQANVWQSVLAIVLGMLGGSFFPLEGAPGWLSRLSSLTPHAWFLEGLGTTAGGGTLADVVAPVGAMLAFAAVVGTAGLLLSRREARA